MRRTGANHGMAAHSDAVVRRARKLNKNGYGLTYAAIGDKLGVNKNTISDWCQYKVRIAANPKEDYFEYFRIKTESEKARRVTDEQ